MKKKQTHYFVDIDGTLADTTHRNKHLTDTRIPHPMRWRTFFREDYVAKDTRLPNTEILNRYLAEDAPVTFLTARPDYLNHTTKEWLKKHFPAYDEAKHVVITKPEAEKKRATPSWKADVINACCKAPNSFVFIDDSPENLEHVKDVRPDGVVVHPREAWEFLKGQYKMRMQKDAQDASSPATSREPRMTASKEADDDDDDDDELDATTMEMLGTIDFDEPRDEWDIIEIEQPDDGEVEKYEGEADEEDYEEDEDI